VLLLLLMISRFDHRAAFSTRSFAISNRNRDSVAVTTRYGKKETYEPSSKVDMLLGCAACISAMLRFDVASIGSRVPLFVSPWAFWEIRISAVQLQGSTKGEDPHRA